MINPALPHGLDRSSRRGTANAREKARECKARYRARRSGGGADAGRPL
jgi:hypothetical protein